MFKKERSCLEMQTAFPSLEMHMFGASLHHVWVTANTQWTLFSFIEPVTGSKTALLRCADNIVTRKPQTPQTDTVL